MVTLRAAMDALETAPVIAAVKNSSQAKWAAEGTVSVAFVLGGSILTMDGIMASLSERGKLAFLHMDLIEGIGRDEAGLEYAAAKWNPAGIISTRAPLVRLAKQLGLLSVQRVFLLDSGSIRSGIALVEQSKPDFVEVMPGLIPKAIGQFCNTGRPVIAGGMVTERSEVFQALSAGALAVSTSSTELWRE